MLKMKYTKTQIVEAIKYWQNVLKTLDESSSPLLNEFVKKFGEDIVFSKQPFALTNDIAYEIAKTLNDILFESSIVNFPNIEVVTYGQYCKRIKFCEMHYCGTPENEIVYAKNNFLGNYYVVIENDFDTLKITDTLDYSHEIVFLNLDKLKYRSFVMNAASICHEFIHVYDKEFGDGEELDKYFILKKLSLPTYNKLSHRTNTFITKQKLAIANNLNVIATMDRKDKMLDKQAIRLMLQALTPEEIQLVKESYAKESKGKSKRKISIQMID